MPTERKPQTAVARPKPTFSYRGESYTFHLGVKGWIQAQQHFAAPVPGSMGLTGPRTVTPAHIVDNMIIPGDIAAVSAVLQIAMGLATPDLEWSDDEIADMIEEVGMQEIVRLIATDLAWVMFPEAMPEDEAAAAGAAIEKAAPSAKPRRARQG